LFVPIAHTNADDRGIEGGDLWRDEKWGKAVGGLMVQARSELSGILEKDRANGKDMRNMFSTFQLGVPKVNVHLIQT
jgi:hypothetical protein